MKRKLTLGTVAVILALLLPPAASRAEDRPRTFIRMEETEIIGVSEHPEITYIIPKTKIRFKPIPLQRSFRGYIIERTHLLDLEKEIFLRSQLGTGP